MTGHRGLLRLGVTPCREPQLALQVVFVDWHGVLSSDPFWWSILSDGRHWLHRQLRRDVDTLFELRTEMVMAWMRGDATAADVIATFTSINDRRCADAFLIRRLYRDCTRMRTQAPVVDMLRSLPELTLKVIATDNMDCFTEAARAIPTLPDVYGMLSSSDVGTLKAEDPERFFGAMLADHGLEPRHALLLDDSPVNCAAFAAWGGTAVCYASPRDLTIVQRWAIRRPQRGLLSHRVFAPTAPYTARAKEEPGTHRVRPKNGLPYRPLVKAS